MGRSQIIRNWPHFIPPVSSFAESTAKDAFRLKTNNPAAHVAATKLKMSTAQMNSNAPFSGAVARSAKASAATAGYAAHALLAL